VHLVVLGVIVVVLLGAHLMVLVAAVFFAAVFFAAVFVTAVFFTAVIFTVVIFGMGDGCELHPGERQRESERQGELWGELHGDSPARGVGWCGRSSSLKT